jgi:hypothetical protein
MRRIARESGDLGTRNNRNTSFSAFYYGNQNNRNQNVVIEEARPPPSYGDIYVSSLDVNPLPTYSTAVQLKTFEANENKSDNNTNQISSSPIIETVNNNNIITANDPNINTTHDIINSNNSSILNGEINLAFVQEPGINSDDNK